MAAQPPPYKEDPSVPIRGGYQQVPAQPHYGAAPPSAPPHQGANTVIVTQQPTVYAQVQPGIKPNNYLVLSIINLLFCFFILGIIALIFSLQVDSAWAAGNYVEAQRNANIARMLNFIGIGVGIGTWVVVVIIVIANVAVAVSAANAYNY